MEHLDVFDGGLHLVDVADGDRRAVVGGGEPQRLVEERGAVAVGVRPA